MSSNAHAVSAPGKVLLAGGYLVLNRAYTGLVFALDARIHAIIDDIPATKGVPRSEVIVQSPQFDEPAWHYAYKATAVHDAGIEVTQFRIDADLPLNKNPFVETALRYGLSYIASTLQTSSLPPSSITILADNDYYTTPLSDAGRFHNFAVPLSKANKTGLGSSAALVTSLTAALLTHYLPKDQFSLLRPQDQQRLHNLAQAAHCAAQGKVGSGFDVASAVFGSCIYRRFSPEILSSLPDPGTAGFAAALQGTVDGKSTTWDHEVRKGQIAVPDGLRMVMCDVSCGSQTPGMVKKVLAWRKSDASRAERIWQELDAANLDLAAALKAAAVAKSRDHTPLSQAFTKVREQIRLMGDESDVPIEPPAQTKLIDACCKLKGVIGGTVPGAGGYDAIVLLIEDKSDVFESLNALFAGWQFDSSVGGQGKVSILRVREEMEGIKQEDAAAYKAYLDHR